MIIEYFLCDCIFEYSNFYLNFFRGQIHSLQETKILGTTSQISRGGPGNLFHGRNVLYVLSIFISFFFQFFYLHFSCLGNANYVEAKMWADFSIKSMWEVLYSSIQCFKSKQSIQNYKSSILCKTFLYSN